MASRGLGTLTLDLIAKIGGFEGPMDRAARTASKRMREIESAVSKGIGGAMKSLAAFGAGFLSVQTVFQGFNAAIDQADKLNDFTKRLGVSAEAISAWGYAASQTGTDIDSLSKGLRLLQKNMAEALDPKSSKAKLFDALGISVKDAEGNLRSLESIVPEISDRFQSLDNAATESALSMELFGKSGADLLEFLNQGSGGLDEFRQRAEELGIVLSQDTLQAADDFNDALGDLKTATQGAMYEALEPLLPVLKDLVTEMVGFANSGDGARQAGESAASGIIQLGNAAKTVFTFLQGLREALNGFQDQAVAYGRLVPEILAGRGQQAFAAINASGARMANAFAAKPQAALPAAEEGIDFTRGAPVLDASLQRRLNRAFSNPSAARAGSKKKEGKSEAEKEAERLLESYQRLEASQREQIALFGETSEAAKLRYELENGELAKLSQAQKDTLIVQAEKLDVMNAEKKISEELADINERQFERQTDVLDAIKEETALLGMSAAQQEVYNNLKAAGVDANSAFGESIIESTKALQEMREETAFLDDLKTGLADVFSGFARGAKEGKDAFDSFMDNLFQRALQFAADKAIQAMFDAFGNTGSSSTSSGTAGGGWAGLFQGIMSAFGGGRAGGGSVSPGGLYRVNERGTEMLSIGGKDYLMMGSNAGMVTPSHRLGGGGGVSQTNHFHYQAPYDARTEEQKNGRLAFETSRAAQRNR